MSLHCVLSYTISDDDKKSGIICIFVTLYIMGHLVDLKIFLLSLIFKKLIMLCIGMSSKFFFCLEVDEFLNL